MFAVTTASLSLGWTPLPPPPVGGAAGLDRRAVLAGGMLGAVSTVFSPLVRKPCRMRTALEGSSVAAWACTGLTALAHVRVDAGCLCEDRRRQPGQQLLFCASLGESDTRAHFHVLPFLVTRVAS